MLTNFLRAHLPCPDENIHLIRASLDDWMANLFVPDRPVSGNIDWYLERKDRCIDQIWKLACSLIGANTDAILEMGLIQQASRQKVYELVDDANFKVRVHVLEAPEDVRRAHVKRRNIERGSTFSIEVPDVFFEMASKMWESPGDVECAERDIRFISTDIASS